MVDVPPGDRINYTTKAQVELFGLSYDHVVALQAARSHCKGRGGGEGMPGPLWLPWGGGGLLAGPSLKCVRERANRRGQNRSDAVAHSDKKKRGQLVLPLGVSEAACEQSRGDRCMQHSDRSQIQSEGV